MKIKRKIIQIDEERCDGCGQCVPSCAEGALEIIDGKARLIAERYCDGLGACLGECPNDALHVIERDAEDFDEEAVEAFLKEKETSPQSPFPSVQPAGGCPSSQVQTFAKKSGAAPRASGEPTESALSHWPVQIRLAPPNAPFLKNADLLIMADCVPVAYPNLHRDFLPGKAVLIGCPKFDNVDEYVQRFTEIFRTANLKSVTVLDMEVPCCSALPVMVHRAMKAAGVEVPMEWITIGRQGDVVKQEKVAA